jgi:hypothetical protein
MALKFQLDTAEALEQLDEPLRALYTETNGKYVLAVEGVKPLSEFEKLTTAITSERKATKAAKDLYSPWETTFQGKTPAEIQAELERIPVLEADATGKIDKSKLDAIVESTTKNRLAPVERERDTFKGKVAELENTIRNYELANKRRTIFDAVREAASKDPTLHESAYATPDAALMLLSERCLTIDDNGNVVVAEGVRNMTEGLPVKEALAELKAQHPYLAKTSLGGGASGSGSGSGGPNPFKENNLQLRGAFIKANPLTWRKSMEQAGLSEPSQMHKGK